MDLTKMNLLAEQIVERDDAPGYRGDDLVVFDDQKPFDTHPKGHYVSVRDSREGIAGVEEFTDAMFGDDENSDAALVLRQAVEKYSGIAAIQLTLRRPPALRDIGPPIRNYVGTAWLLDN